MENRQLISECYPSFDVRSRSFEEPAEFSLYDDDDDENNDDDDENPTDDDGRNLHLHKAERSHWSEGSPSGNELRGNFVTVCFDVIFLRPSRAPRSPGVDITRNVG